MASTVTAACNGGTRTVTNYQQGQTVTVQSTVTRSLTDGQVTSYWTTTASETAVCHYPSTQNNYDGAAAPTARSSFCIGDACNLQARDQEGVNKVQERGIAGSAAVAAITSTYTETTYTVTRTSVTTIPPRTATEIGKSLPLPLPIPLPIPLPLPVYHVERHANPWFPDYRTITTTMYVLPLNPLAPSTMDTDKLFLVLPQPQPFALVVAVKPPSPLSWAIRGPSPRPTLSTKLLAPREQFGLGKSRPHGITPPPSPLSRSYLGFSAQILDQYADRGHLDQSNAVYHFYKLGQCHGLLEGRRLDRCLNGCSRPLARRYISPGRQLGYNDNNNSTTNNNNNNKYFLILVAISQSVLKRAALVLHCSGGIGGRKDSGSI